MATAGQRRRWKLWKYLFLSVTRAVFNALIFIAGDTVIGELRRISDASILINTLMYQYINILSWQTKRQCNQLSSETRFCRLINCNTDYYIDATRANTTQVRGNNLKFKLRLQTRVWQSARESTLGGEGKNRNEIFWTASGLKLGSASYFSSLPLATPNKRLSHLSSRKRERERACTQCEKLHYTISKEREFHFEIR